MASKKLNPLRTYKTLLSAIKKAKKDEKQRKEVTGFGGWGVDHSIDRKKAGPSFLILVPITLMRGTTVLKCAGPTTTAPMCLV